jgi:nitric oxide reductase subunit B
MDVGLWYARSPEVIHSALVRGLVWLRVPGDVVCSVGGIAGGLYALRLLGKRSATTVPAGATAPAAE